MQVVSSAEFATHHSKYLNMAIDQDVRIKMGQKMFRVSYEPPVREQAILEPDEDLRQAITAEELKEKMHVSIHNFFADKQKIGKQRGTPFSQSTTKAAARYIWYATLPTTTP